MVNLWWDCGELWSENAQFCAAKNVPLFRTLFSRAAKTSFERCDGGFLFPFGAHVVVSDDLDAARNLHFFSLDGDGFDDCELRWRWDDSVEAEAGGG
jgi:hypothetical protein